MQASSLPLHRSQTQWRQMSLEPAQRTDTDIDAGTSEFVITSACREQHTHQLWLQLETETREWTHGEECVAAPATNGLLSAAYPSSQIHHPEPTTPKEVAFWVSRSHYPPDQTAY